MAYNKKNFYTKIIEIQETTKRCKSRGMSYTYIYDNYIRKQYHISKRTFDEYMGIPAKRELDKIIAIENIQVNLFKDDN